MTVRGFVRLGVDGADRDDAWQRAERVLTDSLEVDQRDTYARKGYIEVASRLHPGRRYRLDGWRPVAVFSPSGEFEGAICLRPREALPAPDVILAHKLYIEGAEEQFLEAGNWLSPAWRPTTAAPTIVLLLFLVGPWLLSLIRMGFAGIAAALLMALVLSGLGLRRLRSRTGASRAVRDGRPGTPRGSCPAPGAPIPPAPGPAG